MKSEFWLIKSLDELTDEEWESLCDGCGQCCLIKLEDEDNGEVYRTNVSCQLLDLDTCRCKDYPNRFDKVPECVQVSLEKADQFKWMPETCAYRLLYEGKQLFDWHPLISGTRDSVEEAGISMRGRTVPEFEVDDDDVLDHTIEGMN